MTNNESLPPGVLLDSETIASLYRDDQRHVGQTTPFGKAIAVTHTEGSMVWSADGKSYIDLIAGIAVNSVGHANPEVRQAIRDQIEHTLHVNVFGKFLIPAQVRLARRLAQVTPPGLETIFFTNSGTEAIEGALKLARKATGRTQIIAFEGGFHGRTFGALSVSWRDIYRQPFEPLLPDVLFIPFDDLAAAGEAIGARTAAVIVEPIQGEGGVRVPSDDFLPGLRRLCAERGALLVLDEVQTGFGRTGKFFGCEHWGVIPDILVVAKALGGGMPLGGFIARPEVMATLLDPPLSHMTTFGGHPVSCAAGLASLEIILRDGLVERSAQLGRQLQANLRQIGQGCPIITDVRGKGLLIGLELDSAERAKAFVNKAFELGVILSWTIYAGATVRLAPPLTISAQEIERSLAIIEEALAFAQTAMA